MKRALWAMAMAAGPSALGQEGPARVEEGVADVNPQAVGRVDLRADLRTPTGWEDVYLIRPGDPARGLPPLYGRRNGALTAVFPMSVYVGTRDGPVPLIPPGTVFHFGDVPGERADAAVPRRDASFIDSRVDGILPTRAPDAARPTPAPRAAAGSLMTDEAYRQRRIGSLIDRALLAAGVR